jgi:cytochrome c biogenesis factor
MDFLRQPLRPIYIVVLLIVVGAIVAGIWAWRNRSTQAEAQQAHQEVLQQMQREGSRY